MATVIVSGVHQINQFLSRYLSDEQTQNVFSFPYLQEHHLQGELSPNVLITSSAQAEAVLLYIKIGYVLNLKKLKSPLIFLSVILVF